MESLMRDLIVQRIQELRKHPYNGEFAFGTGKNQLDPQETFASYSDAELVVVFERVCRAAYNQR